MALLSLFWSLCEKNKIRKVTVFLESELNLEVGTGLGLPPPATSPVRLHLNNASVCSETLIEYSNLRQQESMNNLVTTYLMCVVCVFVVMKVLNSYIALLNYSSPISSAAKPISKWARSVSVFPVCLDLSLPLGKFLFEVLYHIFLLYAGMQVQ